MIPISDSRDNYNNQNNHNLEENNRLKKCSSVAEALQSVVEISEFNVSNFAFEAGLDVGYFDKMYNGRKRLNSCVTFAKIINVVDLTGEEIKTFTNLFLIQGE